MREGARTAVVDGWVSQTNQLPLPYMGMERMERRWKEVVSQISSQQAWNCSLVLLNLREFLVFTKIFWSSLLAFTLHHLIVNGIEYQNNFIQFHYMDMGQPLTGWGRKQSIKWCMTEIEGPVTLPFSSVIIMFRQTGWRWHARLNQ